MRYLLIFVYILVGCNPGDRSIFNIPKKFQGKVIGVKDGDTIEVLFDGKPIRIRFAHIDCPEIKKGQPFGKAAKQFTSDMCFGQNVTVLNTGEFDRYKRLIAEIVSERGRNINKELVAAGLAWHYKKYSSDSTYRNLELIARHNRIGLWSLASPTAPWEWRASNGTKRKPTKI